MSWSTSSTSCAPCAPPKHVATYAKRFPSSPAAASASKRFRQSSRSEVAGGSGTGHICGDTACRVPGPIRTCATDKPNRHGRNVTLPGAPEPHWSNPQAYEAYMGRWSRPVAHAFLTWLTAPPNRDWVDVGCGTGALTQAILETAQPQSIIGVDPSTEFLDLARVQIPDPRVSFVTGGAEAIPLPGDSA